MPAEETSKKSTGSSNAPKSKEELARAGRRKLEEFRKKKAAEKAEASKKKQSSGSKSATNKPIPNPEPLQKPAEKSPTEQSNGTLQNAEPLPTQLSTLNPDDSTMDVKGPHSAPDPVPQDASLPIAPDPPSPAHRIDPPAVINNPEPFSLSPDPESEDNEPVSDQNGTHKPSTLSQDRNPALNPEPASEPAHSLNPDPHHTLNQLSNLQDTITTDHEPNPNPNPNSNPAILPHTFPPHWTNPNPNPNPNLNPNPNPNSNPAIPLQTYPPRQSNPNKNSGLVPDPVSNPTSNPDPVSSLILAPSLESSPDLETELVPELVMASSGGENPNLSILNPVLNSNLSFSDLAGFGPSHPAVNSHLDPASSSGQLAEERGGSRGSKEETMAAELDSSASNRDHPVADPLPGDTVGPTGHLAPQLAEGDHAESVRKEDDSQKLPDSPPRTSWWSRAMGLGSNPRSDTPFDRLAEEALEVKEGKGERETLLDGSWKVPDVFQGSFQLSEEGMDSVGNQDSWHEPEAGSGLDSEEHGKDNEPGLETSPDSEESKDVKDLAAFGVLDAFSAQRYSEVNEPVLENGPDSESESRKMDSGVSGFSTTSASNIPRWDEPRLKSGPDSLAPKIYPATNHSGHPPPLPAVVKPPKVPIPASLTSDSWLPNFSGSAQKGMFSFEKVNGGLTLADHKSQPSFKSWGSAGELFSGKGDFGRGESPGNDSDFFALEQHIEDLTQEKFALQRSLDLARSLTDSLVQENSGLMEDYNSQGEMIAALRRDMDKLEKEILEQQAVVDSWKVERDRAMDEKMAAVERSQAMVAEVIALEEKLLRVRAQELRLQKEVERLTESSASDKTKIASLQKEKAQLRASLTSLQEEKKQLQLKLRKVMASGALQDSKSQHVSVTAGDLGLAEAGTSTEDLEVENGQSSDGQQFSTPGPSQSVEGPTDPDPTPTPAQDSVSVGIEPEPPMTPIQDRPTDEPDQIVEATPAVATAEEEDKNRKRKSMAESVKKVTRVIEEAMEAASVVASDGPSVPNFMAESFAEKLPEVDVEILENIDSLLLDLLEEKQAMAEALEAESAKNVELRAINDDLSRKLASQTQRMELVVSQQLAAENSQPALDTIASMSSRIEYVDESDEVAERVMSWILRLFPSGVVKA